MSFHDEPLVVDNAPLGIDVGESHGSRPHTPPLLEKVGADWIRRFSQVNKIVVIRKKGAGQNGEIETMTTGLDRERPLELTVTTGSASSTVTFTWEGDGADQLRIKSSGFGFDRNNNSRRLTQNGQQRKISSLKWFESPTHTDPTTFPSAPSADHDSIFVGLYP